MAKPFSLQGRSLFGVVGLMTFLVIAALGIAIAALVKALHPPANSIEEEDLQDGAVSTRALANNAVTLAKMADNSVGTAELVNDSVTYEKLDNKKNVTEITTATYTVTASQSGTVFRLNRAAGIVATLPAATSANIGLEFTFLIDTTFTGTCDISAASSSDIYQGGLLLVDSSPDASATSDLEFFQPGDSDYLISLDSAADGWLAGGRIHMVYTAANSINVDGTIEGTNATLTTPFASS